MNTSDLIFDFVSEPHDSVMLEVEEIVQYEMMEIEALVDMAGPEDLDQPPNRTSSPVYEDTDYDSLFMEFISTEQDGKAMDIDQGQT
jgi:hypothetical protein